MRTDSVGLYIHVPFCPVICPYCSFYKLMWQSDKEALFVRHLLTEMAMYYKRFGAINIDTIYFGGGTPNVLSVDSFQQIMDGIHRYFNVQSDIEFTMEMNPGVRALESLQGFVDMGVRRVSVGVQSFDADVLAFYGRNHSVDDSIRFLDALGDCGIDNVSVDIIFGYKDHSIDQLKQSLDMVVERGIAHVSLYGLSIEPGTPFERQKLTVDETIQYEQYSFIQKTLVQYGYEQYEVSTFSMPKKKSVHNVKYLQFEPVIGIGPGAHSYFMGHRYQNIADYKGYIHQLDGVLPTAVKPLDIAEFELYLATRLRYFQPIFQDDITRLFGVDGFSGLLPKLKEFSNMG